MSKAISSSCSSVKPSARSVIELKYCRAGWFSSLKKRTSASAKSTKAGSSALSKMRTLDSKRSSLSKLSNITRVTSSPSNLPMFLPPCRAWRASSCRRASSCGFSSASRCKRSTMDSIMSPSSIALSERGTVCKKPEPRLPKESLGDCSAVSPVSKRRSLSRVNMVLATVLLTAPAVDAPAAPALMLSMGPAGSIPCMSSQSHTFRYSLSKATPKRPAAGVIRVPLTSSSGTNSLMASRKDR